MCIYEYMYTYYIYIIGGMGSTTLSSRPALCLCARTVIAAFRRMRRRLSENGSRERSRTASGSSPTARSTAGDSGYKPPCSMISGRLVIRARW